jgi:membrane fusion protein (multidrug efflux system)
VSDKQTDVAAANKKKQKQLETAKLNLTYTVITAAIDASI